MMKKIDTWTDIQKYLKELEERAAAVAVEEVEEEN